MMCSLSICDKRPSKLYARCAPFKMQLLSEGQKKLVNGLCGVVDPASRCCKSCYLKISGLIEVIIDEKWKNSTVCVHCRVKLSPKTTPGIVWRDSRTKDNYDSPGDIRNTFQVCRSCDAKVFVKFKDFSTSGRETCKHANVVVSSNGGLLVEDNICETLFHMPEEIVGSVSPAHLDLTITDDASAGDVMACNAQHTSECVLPSPSTPDSSILLEECFICGEKPCKDLPSHFLKHHFKVENEEKILQINNCDLNSNALTIREKYLGKLSHVLNLVNQKKGDHLTHAIHFIQSCAKFKHRKIRKVRKTGTVRVSLGKPASSVHYRASADKTKDKPADSKRYSLNTNVVACEVAPKQIAGEPASNGNLVYENAGTEGICKICAQPHATSFESLSNKMDHASTHVKLPRSSQGNGPTQSEQNMYLFKCFPGTFYEMELANQLNSPTPRS